MKKIKLIAMLVVFCLCSNMHFAVMAQMVVQNPDVVFDAESYKATMSGSSPYGEGSYVTISLTKEGTSTPIYFREMQAGTDGQFTVVCLFKDSDITGTYTAVLSGAGLSAEKKSIVFINTEDNESILEMLNNIPEDQGTTADEKSKTIQTNISYVESTYGISFTDVLDDFEDENKYNVYLSMTNRSFSSAYDIQPEFYKAAVIEKLNDGGTEQTVKDYAEYFGFDIGSGSLFEQVRSNEAKERVYNSVLNKNFSLRDTQAVADAFNEAVYVELINQIDNSERDKLIPLIQECISTGFTMLSLTEYNSNEFDDADRLNIVKEVIKIKDKTLFTSLEEVNDALETAAETVREANKEDNKSSSKGSSGGSRGGGGSGVSLNIEARPNEVKKENEVREEIVTGSSFVDIEHVDWAQEAIEYLTEKNVLSGVGNGYFEPDRAVTREEFVKMIVTALPVPNDPTEKVFYDVEQGSWYYDYIMQAYAGNLVNGISDDYFGVGQELTREQLCAIVFRALNLLNINIETDDTSDIIFTDANEISEYAQEAVQSLARANIINGMGDGSVAPKTPASRAMAAKIIYNILQRGNLL